MRFTRCTNIPTSLNTLTVLTSLNELEVAGFLIIQCDHLPCMHIKAGCAEDFFWGGEDHFSTQGWGPGEEMCPFPWARIFFGDF